MSDTGVANAGSGAGAGAGSIAHAGSASGVSGDGAETAASFPSPCTIVVDASTRRNIWGPAVQLAVCALANARQLPGDAVLLTGVAKTSHDEVGKLVDDVLREFQWQCDYMNKKLALCPKPRVISHEGSRTGSPFVVKYKWNAHLQYVMPVVYTVVSGCVSTHTLRPMRALAARCS